MNAKVLERSIEALLELSIYNANTQKHCFRVLAFDKIESYNRVLIERSTFSLKICAQSCSNALKRASFYLKAFNSVFVF